MKETPRILIQKRLILNQLVRKIDSPNDKHIMKRPLDFSRLFAVILTLLVCACHLSSKPSEGNFAIQSDSSPALINLAELARSPQNFANKKIEVIGCLQEAGINYFTDPFFILMDQEGNWLETQAWAPLEIPPPRLDDAPNPPPPVMRRYLRRWMRIVGTIVLDRTTNTCQIEVQNAQIEAAQPSLSEAASKALQEIRTARRGKLQPGNKFQAGPG
jgi:hypothetical protein